MGSTSSTCRQGAVGNAVSQPKGGLPPAISAEEMARRKAEWEEALGAIMAGRLPNVALTGQKLMPEAIGQLCDALADNDSVKQLELDGNTAGDRGSQHIAQVLATNSTIRSLDLSGNSIGDAGAEVLAESLEHNSTLTFLELSQNNIQGSGAELLGRMLYGNTSLRQFLMAQNKVGSLGGKAIGEALSVNKTLVILGLRNSGLGAEGGSAIARGLTNEGGALMELSLGQNRIMDEAAKEFATMMRTNRVLKELYIDQNRFADEGGAAIAESIMINHTIQTLWMVQNDMSNETVALFAAALQKNKGLRRLGISSRTTLNPEVRQAMNEARAKRRSEERKKEGLPPIPGDAQRLSAGGVGMQGVGSILDSAAGLQRESASVAASQMAQKEAKAKEDSDDEDIDDSDVPDEQGPSSKRNALPRTARAGKSGASRSRNVMDEIRMMDDELDFLEVPREATNMTVTSSVAPSPVDIGPGEQGQGAMDSD